MQTKKVAALLGLAVLITLALVLGVRVAKLVPQVQEEVRTTPTPTPVYGSTMVVTPDPSLPTAPPVLRNGSVGDAVKRAQERLRELGYYEGEIDGQFGNGTQSAVNLFQRQHGLQVDGAIGPATAGMLYSDEAQHFVPPPTAEPTPTPLPTAVPTPTPAAAPQSSVTRKPYLRSDGLPLLVNREHPLASDYKTYDLVELNGYCDKSVVKIKYTDMWAEREAVDALLAMLRAAQEDGVKTWQISAAYRDVAYQQRLFDKQVNEYMSDRGMTKSAATAAARRKVADPGTSEHHTGLAFDITVPGTSFAGTAQAKWLAEHCWDYGFILRYTKEKEAITGFEAEAWHFRYVGVTDARIMRDEGLCLEEYLDKYGVIVVE